MQAMSNVPRPIRRLDIKAHQMASKDVQRTHYRLFSGLKHACRFHFNHVHARQHARLRHIMPCAEPCCGLVIATVDLGAEAGEQFSVSALR